MGLLGIDQGVGRAAFLLEAQRRIQSLLFQPLKVTHMPWRMPLPLCSQPQCPVSFSHGFTLTLLLFLFHLQGPCDHTGSTQIIQDNPHLRMLDLTTSLLI